MLYSAGDVECHLGDDGRHYLLDLARTFPPESAMVCNHLPVVGMLLQNLVYNLIF